jgi:hypothetical protein
MTTLLLSFALFGSAMLLMAVGVIVVGKRLRGSCGGVGNCECTADGVPPESCSRSQEERARTRTLSIAP